MLKTSKCTLIAVMMAFSGGYASADVVDISGPHDEPHLVLNAGDTANLVGDTTLGWETQNAEFDIVLNGYTLRGDSGSGNNFRLNGVISGEGNLELRGRNEVFHPTWRPRDLGFGGTSANTYTGLTTLERGVLHLLKPDNVTAITGDLVIATMGVADVIWHAHNQIADIANIVVNGGAGVGYLTLNGYTDTVASLTLAANSIVNTSGYELVDGAWVIGVNGENGDAGVLTVSSLIVDGQVMAAGQYNSSNSSFVIGDGYINVIPEPASLALIGLGGLLMLKRRRD